MSDSGPAADASSSPVPINSIPVELLTAIFKHLTFDATWEGKPVAPATSMHSNSPLTNAMAVSHTCMLWRDIVTSDTRMWGEMLSTFFFPRGRVQLWWHVLRLSGESPIWLRHTDNTPPGWPCKLLPLKYNCRFQDMFLRTIERHSHRIKRLSLSHLHGSLLARRRQIIFDNMLNVAGSHVTDLRVGTLDCAAQKDDPSDNSDRLLEMERIETSSHALLDFVLGIEDISLRQFQGRPLRALHIHGVPIQVDWLLELLKTTPVLEELDLRANKSVIRHPQWSIPLFETPNITALPLLRKICIRDMLEVAIILLPRITICQTTTCSIDIADTITDEFYPEYEDRVLDDELQLFGDALANLLRINVRHATQNAPTGRVATNSRRGSDFSLYVLPNHLRINIPLWIGQERTCFCVDIGSVEKNAEIPPWIGYGVRPLLEVEGVTRGVEQITCNLGQCEMASIVCEFAEKLCGFVMSFSRDATYVRASKPFIQLLLYANSCNMLARQFFHKLKYLDYYEGDGEGSETENIRPLRQFIKLHKGAGFSSPAIRIKKSC